MSLAALVSTYKPLIDKEIEKEFQLRLEEVKDLDSEIVKIVAAMRELSVGGKRMRGLLTILGYQISTQYTVHSDQEEQEIVRAAVIMELFHLGLLIQDDIMDQDNLRRGVATIHARYANKQMGEALAICAGDLPFGWGMEMLAKLKLPLPAQAGITNLQITNAMAVWGRYFYRVGYGQILDVLKVADEASLLKILALKSGEYSCVLPLSFGAALGGADDELISSLSEYGMELGWVFQLRDDYLSEWGKSEQTGKPVGNDRREGKHSFALMYGKDKLEAEIARHVKEAKRIVKNNLRIEQDHKQIFSEIVEWVANRDN